MNNKNEKLAPWVEVSIPDFDGVVQLLCIVIRRQKNVKCVRSSLYLIELRLQGTRPTCLACTNCRLWRALTVGCVCLGNGLYRCFNAI